MIQAKLIAALTGLAVAAGCQVGEIDGGAVANDDFKAPIMLVGDSPDGLPVGTYENGELRMDESFAELSDPDASDSSSLMTLSLLVGDVEYALDDELAANVPGILEEGTEFQLIVQGSGEPTEISLRIGTFDDPTQLETDSCFPQTQHQWSTAYGSCGSCWRQYEYRPGSVAYHWERTCYLYSSCASWCTPMTFTGTTCEPC
jgi:hypothetical protein